MSDCPLHGKCRRCCQPGHIARNCIASTPSSAPVPSVPAASSTPAPSDDVSDSVSDSDELASGDEEVLAAAGDVSLSPRRTRSSLERPAESPVPSDADRSSDPPPSLPPSDVPAVASSYAVVFREDDVACSIDLHRLTRRCVVEDSATPEMYRDCFYADSAALPFLPVMYVFPPGRVPDPLPDALVLSPDVPPAKFPS